MMNRYQITDENIENILQVIERLYYDISNKINRNFYGS